uniref:DNA ligase 4 n=1 Tax=Ciona savignyi TaxID=51511 RepID=H2ZIX8_CIOSA
TSTGAVKHYNEADGVASKIPFHQLCQLFEKIHKAKSKYTQRFKLKTFLSKWRDLQRKFQVDGKTGTCYPAIRLILPQLDKDRPSYGLKEVLLARLYVDVMGLSRTGKDAKKLLEFRNPKVNTSSAGDFAETAYRQLLSKRCIDKGSLTITQINTYLDKIATYNTEKKKDLVRKTLLEIIQKTSGIEQKWLIRIILKDTKLRMGHKVILQEIHPDAEELFNVTTSLKQVCRQLNDPDVRLADTEIKLFQPFRPMLALNAAINEVDKLMENKPFNIEIKYDGERSQMHKEGNCYKYFSRSGKEYSTVFGETPYIGTLTPFIHNCFDDSVHSCILDGEMMGFDPQLNIFMQKGGKFDIKHVTEDSDLQPCFVVFDILYLNDELLTSKPQIERFNLFNKLIVPVEGRMHLTEAKQASSNKEVVASLNEAIDRREEGIIVKNPSAKYCPNKRKGSGWFKIKPEYVGGVVDDLDLAVIGATFGTGHHGNMLSMFHLGVGVRDSDDTSRPPEVFKSFCRIGSGYTDKQLLQIVAKIKDKLKVFDKKKVPDWLRVTKEKPDVYIHPRDSIVVQVRATEILASASYAANCTLRFPRLISLREDKSYLDALDTIQLENLRSIADGKLAARHASLSDQPSQPKRRKLKLEPRATVSSNLISTDFTDIEQLSTSFENKIFCVLSGSDQHPKQDLEKEIFKHGGKIVQNPTPETFCVVVKNIHNVRVRNVIRSQKYNVVRLDWLLMCLESGTLIPWEPHYMLFATQATKAAFSKTYDVFGDTF